jgi:hypothetical protein
MCADFIYNQHETTCTNGFQGGRVGHPPVFNSITLLGVLPLLVTTETLDALIATDITEASSSHAGPLNGVKAILFTNNISPTKTTALSALTVPTYTGYASQTITWGAAYRDVNLNIGIDTQLLSWVMGDALTPTTVYGWAIVDSTGATLYAAELFASPVQLVDTLSLLAFVAEWIVSNNAQGQATLVAS